MYRTSEEYELPPGSEPNDISDMRESRKHWRNNCPSPDKLQLLTAKDCTYFNRIASALFELSPLQFLYTRFKATFTQQIFNKKLAIQTVTMVKAGQ